MQSQSFDSLMRADARRSGGTWLWPLAVLAGAAQALSLAWPWGGEPLWWLQLLSMIALAFMVQRAATPRRAGLLAWAFSTAWLCGTFWWLFISMHTYGGLAAPLAIAAVVGLAAFLGSYYGFAIWIYRRIPAAHVGWSVILFAVLWLLAELARGQWWTGFPWGAGGYAHVDGPLAPIARVVGVYGIGFTAALIAATIVNVRAADFRKPSFMAGIAVLGVMLAVLHAQRNSALEAASAKRSTKPISLALLQGNIPQDEKFQAGSGIPIALKWYADELRAAKADLVIAPETAIPLLPQQLIPGYLEGITERYTQTGGQQALLLGIPLGNSKEGYTNSALGFAPGEAQAYQYDKHHLVPFGEFIPPFFRWFTQMMNIPLGDFNRGAIGQPSFAWRNERIAPNICYEDLFGEEIGARFIDPANAPTLMVNLSNIGWFGDSLAIDQHLAISRMRALEFERPMVRATNTGATAVIDERGVVTQRMSNFTRGAFEAEVHGVSGTVTPYALWVSRWGLWPLWAFGLIVVLVGWLRRR